MTTSRIFITGQKSVEIDDFEINHMKYLQARSVGLHMRLISMVLKTISFFILRAFKYTLYVAVGTIMFSIFFNEAGMTDLIVSLQKASPIEILEILKGSLVVCVLIALMAVAFVVVYSPSQFGFKDVFKDDLFDRLAHKLKIKKHQIKFIVEK